MTTQRRRRPGTESTGASVQVGETISSIPRGADVVTARAAAAPPCPGRRLWVVWVGRCPWCTTGHVHRVGAAWRLLAGEVIRICPTTGRPYLLAPVRRQREAVRHRAA